jgi:hypothetical protein
MVEVFVNGSLIDVDQDTTIAASYGNVSFGELSKRRGAKTNNWSAPFSPTNKLVFGSCEVAGSWSDVPYRKGTIRVDLDGVTVFEGWCMLDESKDEYEILAFAGASDFYSLISQRNLRTLDLSQYDHNYNETVIRNSWNNTDGYIYAFVEYGKEWNGSLVPPDSLKPQIFFKDVVKAIVANAGYTITGEVLTDPKFLKHVIIPTVFPWPFTFGQDVDLAAYLPDLLQSKVWLDFANIYGLQFDVDDQVKEIRADYIDDILFAEPEDWTGKVDTTERHKTSYRFSDYGQLSYLRYKEMKLSNVTFPDYSKEVAIDDHTLKETADIYKSEFCLIWNATTPTVWNTYTFSAKNGFSGIWNSATSYVYNGSEGSRVWYQGSYYKSIQTGTNKVPPAEPLYWEAIPEADVFDVVVRPTYGMLESDPVFYVNVAFSTGAESIYRKVTNRGLLWTEIYPTRYRVFSRILQRTKIVEMLLKLSYSDINQLDFTRPKRIDNELYIVQSIDQYKVGENESTVVDLIRL